MLLLTHPNLYPTAYHQCVATKRIQRDRAFGVPLEFIEDNLHFDGIICKRYYDECMRIKDILEQGRTFILPGDRLLMRMANGEVYEKDAHIDEHFSEELLHVCLGDPVPHIRKSSSGVYCQTSGGPWELVEKKNVRDTGCRRTKMFWTWGGYAGADRGLYFRANVKLWEVNMNWK